MSDIEEQYDRLLHAVASMRQAQVRYFRTRDRKDLADCKRLEREVDNLTGRGTPAAACPDTQLDLFRGQP